MLTREEEIFFQNGKKTSLDLRIIYKKNGYNSSKNSTAGAQMYQDFARPFFAEEDLEIDGDEESDNAKISSIVDIASDSEACISFILISGTRELSAQKTKWMIKESITDTALNVLYSVCLKLSPAGIVPGMLDTEPVSGENKILGCIGSPIKTKRSFSI